ncbi:MAG: monovalent cation/H(+) antiporter subunit G [Bacillota bacterium]
MVMAWVSGTLLGLGVFFFAVGTLGLLRLPDVYTRMHATTKADTLGAGLVLLGLGARGGSPADLAKLGLLIVFVWLTSPTAAHVMARAAYRAGITPVAGTVNEEGARR